MSPKYKLTYFNSRGLLEPSRLILAYAGVEYEDIRFGHDEWPEKKSSLNLPFGKLPILEFDGNVIAESRAIARYLAKEHGLAGKNNLEQAKADMLVDGVADIFAALGNYYHEADEARKEVLKKKLAEETVPTALKNFLEILQKSESGFFVGDAITWADFVVFNGLQVLNGFYANILDNYSGLKSFSEKISNIPSIKVWIEKRPVTQM